MAQLAETISNCIKFNEEIKTILSSNDEVRADDANAAKLAASNANTFFFLFEDKLGEVKGGEVKGQRPVEDVDVKFYESNGIFSFKCFGKEVVVLSQMTNGQVKLSDALIVLKYLGNKLTRTRPLRNPERKNNNNFNDVDQDSVAYSDNSAIDTQEIADFLFYGGAISHIADTKSAYRYVFQPKVGSAVTLDLRSVLGNVCCVSTKVVNNDTNAYERPRITLSEGLVDTVQMTSALKQMLSRPRNLITDTQVSGAAGISSATKLTDVTNACLGNLTSLFNEVGEKLNRLIPIIDKTQKKTFVFRSGSSGKFFGTPILAVMMGNLFIPKAGTALSILESSDIGGVEISAMVRTLIAQCYSMVYGPYASPDAALRDESVRHLQSAIDRIKEASGNTIDFKVVMKMYQNATDDKGYITLTNIGTVNTENGQRVLNAISSNPDGAEQMAIHTNQKLGDKRDLGSVKGTRGKSSSPLRGSWQQSVFDKKDDDPSQADDDNDDDAAATKQYVHKKHVFTDYLDMLIESKRKQENLEQAKANATARKAAAQAKQDSAQVPSVGPSTNVQAKPAQEMLAQSPINGAATAGAQTVRTSQPKGLSPDDLMKLDNSLVSVGKNGNAGMSINDTLAVMAQVKKSNQSDSSSKTEVYVKPPAGLKAPPRPNWLEDDDDRSAFH